MTTGDVRDGLIVAAWRRACGRYPGWRICTDFETLWIAIRGGSLPVRLADFSLEGLVAQVERAELAEAGELDAP